MTLLTPLALLAGLLALPILLLYMLRLRRREVMVSSHFLWRQVLQDTEANTPWQRLRRNLLLLLQLIILALLVLALARPAQVVETLSAGRTVLLLDASASMNAADVDGTTRFEAAKTQALQIISSLGAGDEMTIVRVSDVTEPLTPYTGDAQVLRQAVLAAQPGQGGGDWQTALTLAAAGAEGAENFNIIIIGDGNIPVDAGKLPETIPQPVFIPVGQSSDNLAVSALAARALPGQNPQLFAQVQNYGAEDAPVSLVVRLDGELWQSASQTISANSQRSFVFNVDIPFSTAEASVVYDDDVTDYLALDDKAFTTTAEAGTRRALMMSERGNRFLEQILGSIPGVQTFRGDVTQRLPEQPYDLYIFDGWLPEVLPTGDMLIINPPRSTPLFTVGEMTEEVNNILVPERAHPILTYVDFRAVNLRQFRPISEAAWAETLVQSDEGALLLAGTSEGRQIVLIPFDLRDSDLPLQIAFPILMSNIVEWFTPANVITGTDGLRVGDALPLNFPVNATAASITLPDGAVQPIEPDSDAPIFADTDLPGLYALSVDAGGETQVYPFAVNLFGTGESDITPQTSVDVGGGERQTDADARLSLREFWSIAALLALAVLLLEWVLYHRRMQIPTTFRPIDRSTARR
jgi:Ca-activated chloride channel family protein